MKLVSFGVQKYRSIAQANLALDDLTILVGPNNEGKSNILNALVLGMRVLQDAGHFRLVKGRYTGSTVTNVRRYAGSGYSDVRYQWERDFPIANQEKMPDGRTILDFEFELSEDELSAFKTQIKSSLNGVLPIRLSIGKGDPEFRVRKRGPGAKTLTAKVDDIATFLGERINIEYIPSVRTSKAAQRVVDEMVGRELRKISVTPAYQKAREKIEELQEPILRDLAETVAESLREFLPEVNSVVISLEPDRYAVPRHSEVVVDDGNPTSLELKGDGVQSLAAISLLRHVSQQSARGRELVLAIEEPEAHLHPKAIHQLRGVLREIASSQQVILTTHSPLLVNRGSLAANIIVEGKNAQPAASIANLRDVLGVRVSDNLQSAELVLVVEGETDRIATEALFGWWSPAFQESLEEGVLAVDSLRGGGNLAYKLSQLRAALCRYHVLLDNDDAGNASADRAEQEGLLSDLETNFTTVKGMKESELEDWYDVDLYATRLKDDFGVDIRTPSFRSSGLKWSGRMAEVFRDAGKRWNKSICAKAKAAVAEEVVRNPHLAVNDHKSGPLEGLLASLETSLGYEYEE